MISPSKGATDNVSILSDSNALGMSGMVFVTTSFSIGELFIFCSAAPERTGWVQAPNTRCDPLFFNALAAFTMVPAVSTISSINIASFPSISPMTFMTSASLARGRRLSINANEAPIFCAKKRARPTPPASGDTTTGSLRPSCRNYSASKGMAEAISTGLSKNPIIAQV